MRCTVGLPIIIINIIFVKDSNQSYSLGGSRCQKFEMMIPALTLDLLNRNSIGFDKVSRTTSVPSFKSLRSGVFVLSSNIHTHMHRDKVIAISANENKTRQNRAGCHCSDTLFTSFGCRMQMRFNSFFISRRSPPYSHYTSGVTLCSRWLSIHTDPREEDVQN